MNVISVEAIKRRQFWVSEIVRISGNFGEDSTRVERELVDEISLAGPSAILDHLRLCGAIPESYGHDTSEEKLYSKYTDAVLALAFRSMGLASLVLTERADVADVEVWGPKWSFVADAKVFRVSRTAKNQKDFKVVSMNSWKRGKSYAIVAAPLYQMPTRTSQIYEQAISHDVCILSLPHVAVLVSFAMRVGFAEAQELLGNVLQSVKLLNPSKDAIAYWSSINRSFLNYHDVIPELWSLEKLANLESISVAKEEGLTYLTRLREEIMSLSHSEAVKRLIHIYKIEGRIQKIMGVRDTGILSIP